jgi:hypothetical protein
VQKHRIGLKGPMTTPIGKGFRSLNLTLRKVRAGRQQQQTSMHKPGTAMAAAGALGVRAAAQVLSDAAGYAGRCCRQLCRAAATAAAVWSHIAHHSCGCQQGVSNGSHIFRAGCIVATLLVPRINQSCGCWQVGVPHHSVSLWLCVSHRS